MAASCVSPSSHLFMFNLSHEICNRKTSWATMGYGGALQCAIFWT